MRLGLPACTVPEDAVFVRPRTQSSGLLSSIVWVVHPRRWHACARRDAIAQKARNSRRGKGVKPKKGTVTKNQAMATLRLRARH